MEIELASAADTLTISDFYKGESTMNRTPPRYYLITAHLQEHFEKAINSAIEGGHVIEHFSTCPHPKKECIVYAAIMLSNPDPIREYTPSG